MSPENGLRLALVVVVGAITGAAAGGTAAWLIWLLVWAPYSNP